MNNLDRHELLDLEPTVIELDMVKGGFVVDPEDLDIQAEFSRTRIRSNTTRSVGSATSGDS